MKFKQAPKDNQEDTPEIQKEEKSSVCDEICELIQLEIKKIALITSAKHYFHRQGMNDYVKFLEGLCKECDKLKGCLISHVLDTQEVPEFTIPKLVVTFQDRIEPFKALAEIEDKFVEKLTEIITTTNENKDWNNFVYLTGILNKVDHICCRALAAVENKSNLLSLCEQHILEK